MTEHCINNGSSHCQTKDATHILMDQYSFSSRTLGFTYRIGHVELIFTAEPNFDVLNYKLVVQNLGQNRWYMTIYDDPFNRNSSSSTVVLNPGDNEKVYGLDSYVNDLFPDMIITNGVHDEFGHRAVFDAVFKDFSSQLLPAENNSTLDKYNFADISELKAEDASNSNDEEMFDCNEEIAKQNQMIPNPNDNKLHIAELDNTSLSCINKYCYTGILDTIRFAKINNMMSFSQKYGILHLKENIELQLLFQDIEPKDLVLIYNIAKDFCLEHLYLKTEKMLCNKDFIKTNVLENINDTKLLQVIVKNTKNDMWRTFGKFRLDVVKHPIRNQTYGLGWVNGYLCKLIVGFGSGDPRFTTVFGIKLVKSQNKPMSSCQIGVVYEIDGELLPPMKENVFTLSNQCIMKSIVGRVSSKTRKDRFFVRVHIDFRSMYLAKLDSYLAIHSRLANPNPR